MKRCALQNCTSKSSRSNIHCTVGISFHRFPTDPNILQKWMTVFETFKLRLIQIKTLYICSLHFKKGLIDYNSVRPYLRRNAIPSEFNFNEEDIQCKNQKKSFIENTIDIEMNTESVDEKPSIISEEYVFSLHQTCRTCLKNIKNTMEMKNIFEHNNNEINIIDELTFITLNVSCDDGLPQNICIQCINNLKKMNIFRHKCEQSQEMLEQHFKNAYSISSPSLLLKPHMYEKQKLHFGAFEFINIENDANNRFPSENVIKAENEEIDNLLDNDDGINSYNISSNNNNYNDNSSENIMNTKQERETKQHNNYKNVITIVNRRDSDANDDNNNDYIKNKENCNVEKEWNCLYCKAVFAHLNDLRDHKREIHQKMFRCSICKASFRLAKNCDSHMKCHYEGNPLQCDVCKRIFKTTIHLRNHKTYLHTEHICPHCSLKCVNIRRFRHHLNIHNKKHKCKFCKKSFAHQHLLTYHIRMHTKERPFLCYICGEDFKLDTCLATHLEIHSGVQHSCDICNKSFATKYRLRLHLRIHTDVRPFQCDICLKAFKAKFSIKKHMSVHGHSITPRNTNSTIISENYMTNTINVKVFPYSCELCEKKFKLSSSLTSHMKMHSEERKYVCPTCGMAFKRPTHLTIHINGVHLKLKPYKCEQCGKSFQQNGEKNIHMRIHTGEKPYKCIYCDKGFRESKTMRAHMRFHTGEKPYQCEICYLHFTTYLLLSNHTAKYHKHTINNNHTLKC